MATVIRPAISEKNKYWISKHRHYELKHFCLQYPMWKKEYTKHLDLSITSSKLDSMPSSNLPGDLVGRCATMLACYAEKIKMIEKAAMDADEFLYTYILKAVTEGLSYTHLKSQLNIPCGKDMYYDRYRRFFWLLDSARD